MARYLLLSLALAAPPQGLPESVTAVDVDLNGAGNLSVAQTMLFGKGRADNFGADVTIAPGGRHASVKFWLSDDGSQFLLVTSARGQCVLYAGGAEAEHSATLQTHQQRGLQCTPRATTERAPFMRYVVDVEEDAAFAAACEAQFQGGACETCVYDAQADACTAPVPESVTAVDIDLNGAGNLSVAHTMLFGKGRADNFGADVTIAPGGRHASVKFWLSDDGSQFLLVTSAHGQCVLYAGGAEAEHSATLQTHQQRGLQCTPRATTERAPFMRYVVDVEEDAAFAAACEAQFQGGACETCVYDAQADACTAPVVVV